MTRVAVVQGGPSSEAEVSRASAASVSKALAAAGHDVTRVELGAGTAEELRRWGGDVVFPVSHGAVGEDGCLQGLLEVLGLPYVGSGVLASALAMDKRAAKVHFAARGLPVAPGLAFGAGDGAPRELGRRALAEIGARLVVKPCSNGSAIGVALLEAATDESVGDAIARALAVDDVVLVEHFARGREVTCGVLEGGALPPTEIRSPHDAFYTYEARYAPGRSLHECPASLPDGVAERVREVAEAAFAALGCRDLARVDFVVGDEGDPSAVTLLEVNTLPGFTETSLFPEAAAVAGVPMPELCHRLVAAALARGAARRNPSIPLPK